MDECELKPCPFFNATTAKFLVLEEILKQRYCLGKKSECARYIVYEKLGAEKVPLDLFPYETDKAIRVISRK